MVHFAVHTCVDVDKLGSPAHLIGSTLPRSSITAFRDRRLQNLQAGLGPQAGIAEMHHNLDLLEFEAPHAWRSPVTKTDVPSTP